VNKKILIAAIVLVVVSIVGTVVLNTLLANNNSPQSTGTLVFQSDETDVNITILGPEETIRTGTTGNNRQLTFTNLLAGNYRGIATKEGYSPSEIMGTSVVSGKSSTILISLVLIQSEEPVFASTNPNAINIKQGNSGTIVVTVTSLNDYAGQVSLNCYDLPSGVVASFDPADVTISAGGKESLTLTLTVSLTAEKGIYSISWGVVSGNHEAAGLGFLLQVS